MNDKQIQLFSASILISDVISYIDNNKEEYEKFLKEESERGNKNDENSMYS